MHRRIPGSMRTRHELSDLIKGRLSSADARGQLVELATRLIIEEALEHPCLESSADPGFFGGFV